MPGLMSSLETEIVLLNLNKQHKAIVDAMRQSDADSAYEGSLEHLRYVRKIVGG